ncbi:11108_t:CDS:2 [Entrophospora sp. SA101]|nr:11108_t:CDS:2 [Entrophospora sp. SA101]
MLFHSNDVNFQNSSQKENRRTSIKRLRTEPSLAIKNITNTIPTSITTG